MKKLTTLLGFALVAVSLGGCELYIGEDRPDQNCEEGFCPQPQPPGADCKTNADCAAGCFCAVAAGEEGGKCEEAGFCATNEDCADGTHCEVDRSSCVPDQCNAATNDGCDTTEGCSGGTCVSMSCKLPNEQECLAGNASGNFKTPQSCPVGHVPMSFNGCYAANSACQVIDLCDGPPACVAFQHEADCLRAVERPTNADPQLGSCGPIYQGNNCTSPTGQPCTTPGANCTCESFTYRGCDAGVAQ